MKNQISKMFWSISSNTQKSETKSTRNPIMMKNSHFRSVGFTLKQRENDDEAKATIS